MKLLCAACDRLAEPSAFRIEGATLIVECGRCGAESRAEAAPREAAVARAEGPGAPLPEKDPFSPPDGFCPKCVEPRSAKSAACPRCGLVFVNFDPGDHVFSDWVIPRWRKLLSEWSSAQAHERFINEALAREELAGVGRLYRIRRARSPEDAMAGRGLESVLRLSMTASLGRPSAPPEARGGGEAKKEPLPGTGKPLSRATAVGLGLLFLSLVAATFMQVCARRP